MNPRVREAIENLLISAVPEEAKDEFRLRGDKIAKLCGEVAAYITIDHLGPTSITVAAIRSEFDIGGNDGR